jgi:hypothetical protein
MKVAESLSRPRRLVNVLGRLICCGVLPRASILLRDRPPCNPARRLLTLPALPARLRAMSVRHRRRRLRALAGEVVGRAKADQRLMRQAEDQKRVEALQARRVWAGGT